MFFTLFVLTHYKLLWRVLGPVPTAFCLSILSKSASSYNHCDIVLYEHLPEVIQCLRKRALSCYYPFVALQAFVVSREWRIYVARVDVVSLWLERHINPHGELDPRLLVSDDIDVSVPA